MIRFLKEGSMKARKRFTQAKQDGLQLAAMVNFIARLGVILFMCATSVLGQGTTASLTGTITDPSGAAIMGAQVVARNVQTNLERTVTAGSTGNYVLPQLPPGQYSVSITSQDSLLINRTTLSWRSARLRKSM